MKYSLKSISLLLLCLTLVTSCKKDEDKPSSSSSSSNDNTHQISVDEYPNSGNEIGEVNSSLNGNVSYSLVFESVPYAFSVNSETGKLHVLDWLVYDFEINPTITATILSTNGTEVESIDVTININDVDDIWAFLNDSRASYENALPGTWIKVQENEYNNLANYLADVAKSGQSDDIIYNGSSIQSGGANYTVSNNNGIHMVQGSYLFAFKYYTYGQDSQGCKVKLSQTSHQNNLETVGSDLPVHNSGYNFFVLKGSNAPTFANAYLGIYESNTIGYKTYGPGNYYYESGNVGDLSNDYYDRAYLYQGLSTTFKQWD